MRMRRELLLVGDLNSDTNSNGPFSSLDPSHHSVFLAYLGPTIIWSVLSPSSRPAGSESDPF